VSLSKPALSHIKPASKGASLDNNRTKEQDQICVAIIITTVRFIGYL
jgi:hypothetical protein